MGGTKGRITEPRRLHPLLLRDRPPKAIDWKLQAWVQINEELPPLNREGEGGQALASICAGVRRGESYAIRLKVRVNS
ncbi:putative phage integrase family domain protein [Synechococcus sp. BIOS-E4-1]|uniref:hypothetical protein n=1 Tax=Synechococcus sp. BIOS-E4-1 TaxID=1400864 RepID=UPI00185F3E6F|nr:hypothetical protein [Synechococcus sp. BIOS-E4-1]QNI54615.1 putative phage integrase family domain protein [Synechococcus sp. BIOS-E4-1]